MSSPTVFELNDAEIRASRGGKVVARSPGFAVVRDDGVFLGEAAQRLAHLHPRQTYNRFWSNLNQDALALPARHFRHHADLAYAHLGALHEQAGKPTEVVFAVPGSFNAAQLSLLLGIAQACRFTTIGMVDAAVAAAAAAAGAGSYLHLDMQLHQSVFTHIDVGEQVVRGAVETVDDGGIAGIRDVAAALIADLFVQHCRFDPLRHAETEQALYDQLPLCFQALTARQETLIEIRFKNSGHQAKLSRAALLERLDDRYRGWIARLTDGRIPLLGDRLAALPGFTARLPQAHVLDAESVFRGCEQNLAALRSSPPNLSFVTRLPAPEKPAITAPATAVTERAAPAVGAAPRAVTHMLLGHCAYPLRESAIFLSAAGSVSTARHGTPACSVALNSRAAVITPLSDISIYVNGIRLAGQKTLGAGDKVGFAGSDTVYTFISVVDPDGA